MRFPAWVMSILIAWLATIALLVASAGSGARASDEPLYGVQTGYVGEADLDRLARGGGDIIRLPVGWHDVQPVEDGPYRWELVDIAMAAASRAGVRVMPVVVGSPEWAAETSTEQPRSPKAVAAFEAFLRALVERYGSSGSFWPSVAPDTTSAVVGWQIWNEPDDDRFWAGDPSPGSYAEFVALCRAAMRSVDPSAVIVLSTSSAHAGRTPIHRWLRRVYDAPGAREAFDVVGTNPYDAQPREIVNQLERIRSLMRSRGDGRKPIWVTEIGWATDGPPRNDLVTSRRGQAKMLRRSFALLRDRAGRLGIDVVIWHIWRDSAAPDDRREYLFPHMGLFDLEGRPKPAWRSFAKFNGGVRGDAPLPD